MGFTDSFSVSILQQENATLRLQNRQLTIQSRLRDEEVESLFQKVCKWKTQLIKTKAKLSFITWKMYHIVEQVYTEEPRNVGDAEVKMAEVLHQTLNTVLVND
jgi:regulator of replication initiation timing